MPVDEEGSVEGKSGRKKKKKKKAPHFVADDESWESTDAGEEVYMTPPTHESGIGGRLTPKKKLLMQMGRGGG